MGIRGLAEYFIAKYAGVADLEADTSFGAPINGKAVRILKDALVNIYSSIQEDVTVLPEYQELNKVLADNDDWSEFHHFIINHVNYIEANDLRKGFNYSIKCIQKLTDLRFKIAKSAERKTIDPEVAFAMTELIRRVGDHIWVEAKDILNIHNLRGLLIRLPEAEAILKELTIKPTWKHGPMKNPNPRQVMKVRQTPVTDMMTRLQDENLYDDAKKKLGPNAPQAALDAEVARVKKEKRNAVALKSYHNSKKKNQGGGEE